MSFRQVRWSVGVHRVFLCAAIIWLVYGYARLAVTATQNREFYVHYLENQSALQDPIPPSPSHASNRTAGPIDLDALAKQVVADDEMERYRQKLAGVRIARPEAKTELVQFRASYGYRYPVLAPAVPPYLPQLFSFVLLPVLAAYALFGAVLVGTRWVLRGFAPRREE